MFHFELKFEYLEVEEGLTILRQCTAYNQPSLYIGLASVGLTLALKGGCGWCVWGVAGEGCSG